MSTQTAPSDKGWQLKAGRTPSCAAWPAAPDKHAVSMSLKADWAKLLPEFAAAHGCTFTSNTL